jgi:hypothetical protein
MDKLKLEIKALNAVNGGGYVSDRAWAYAWYMLFSMRVAK